MQFRFSGFAYLRTFSSVAKTRRDFPSFREMAAEEDDGFIVVSGRKAGRRRQFKQVQPSHHDESVNIEQLTLKIESLIQELKESQFYSDLTCTSVMFYQLMS